jgi:hypothetical protein
MDVLFSMALSSAIPASDDSRSAVNDCDGKRALSAV